MRVKTLLLSSQGLYKNVKISRNLIPQNLTISTYIIILAIQLVYVTSKRIHLLCM